VLEKPRRHWGNVPDVVGDVLDENFADLETCEVTLRLRHLTVDWLAGVAEDQHVFGHDVRMVVTRIRFLDEHSGSLYPRGCLVPDDVLMEDPPIGNQTADNVKGDWIVNPLVQHCAYHHRKVSARPCDSPDFTEGPRQPFEVGVVLLKPMGV